MAAFDHFEGEVFAKLGKVKYHGFDDMVYGMELTYDENMDVSDIKHTSATSIGYTLQEKKWDISSQLVAKYLLPDDVKVEITIDDIRLGSNLTTNKTITSTKKSFLYPVLGIT